MRNSFSLTALALASLTLGASMVARAADEPRPPPYNLILEGNLPDATVLNVTVDAKGMKPQSLTLVGGKLSNGVSIPAERGRRVSLIALNADGKVLYEGAANVDIGKEFTPQVSVELKSTLDGSPGEITLASHRIAVEFAAVERDGKPFTRLTADVFDANGRRLEVKPDDFAWEIDDPQIREGLLPCPIISGAPVVCVDFVPVRPERDPFAFNACFRKGICKLEPVPPITPVWRKVAVSMGSHACALKLSGELYCWGQGEHGQLGYVAPKSCFPTGEAGGTTWGCSGFAQPVVCASGPCRFTDVSTGTRHTCAVDTNQDAWCWGDNYDGALGTDDFDPTNIGSPVPRLVVGGLKFLSIHAAFGATCGLTVTHDVYCWGNNNLGVIPSLSSGWANDPRLVSTPEVIDTLDYANTHACGRAANGNLYCWGSNAGGEMGILNYTGTAQCSSCPAVPLLMQARIPGLMNQPASLISTGAYGSCAHLTNDNTPCWGWATPVFTAGRSLDRLSRGYKHYCAISRGDMTCAGSSALGDGSAWHNDPGVGPVRVSSPPAHFRELDTGNHATCAIGYDENVYCWGSNSYGRLGLGIGGFVTKPTALVFPITLRIPPKDFVWRF